MIRPATQDDLDSLVAIEQRAFRSDRFSRRAFRYLLSRANAATLVDDGDGTVRGYATVTFSRGTSLARLYSIAVDPPWQRLGLGAGLLNATEDVARNHEVAYMRLEVRADAIDTIAFYRAHGYRPFKVQSHYYEDDADAIRMEKLLAPPPDANLARIPYYAQTLDFTCGPAALLMAMRALDPEVPTNQTAELRLWREATTVFMTSGFGGCSPEGLALAAKRRGFTVELLLSDDRVFFVDSVRSPMKREVIRLVQRDFRAQLAGAGVRVRFGPVSIDMLRARFEAGAIPVVLISSYRFDRAKQPHWVVITGFDEKFVYLHDPNVDKELGKSATDCMRVPVPQAAFVKMARYGKAQLQAATLIAKDPA